MCNPLDYNDKCTNAIEGEETQWTSWDAICNKTSNNQSIMKRHEIHFSVIAQKHLHTNLFVEVHMIYVGVSYHKDLWTAQRKEGYCQQNIKYI